MNGNRSTSLRQKIVLGLLFAAVGVAVSLIFFRVRMQPLPPVNDQAAVAAKRAESQNAPHSRQTPAKQNATEAEDLHVKSGWGHLRGRFVFRGKPPERKRIVANKGIPTCTEMLFDESLIVASDGGLKNVFVWLVTEELIHPPPVHPDYAKSANDKVEFQFKQCCLYPHAGLLRTTQKLVEDNKDKISHDPKLGLWSNAPS